MNNMFLVLFFVFACAIAFMYTKNVDGVEADIVSINQAAGKEVACAKQRWWFRGVTVAPCVEK